MFRLNFLQENLSDIQIVMSFALFTAICLEYAKMFSCLQYPDFLLEHIATAQQYDTPNKSNTNICSKRRVLYEIVKSQKV